VRKLSNVPMRPPPDHIIFKADSVQIYVDGCSFVVPWCVEGVAWVHFECRGDSLDLMCHVARIPKNV
jgi:hypothetical protein